MILAMLDRSIDCDHGWLLCLCARDDLDRRADDRLLGLVQQSRRQEMVEASGTRERPRASQNEGLACISGGQFERARVYRFPPHDRSRSAANGTLASSRPHRALVGARADKPTGGGALPALHPPRAADGPVPDRGRRHPGRLYPDIPGCRLACLLAAGQGLRLLANEIRIQGRPPLGNLGTGPAAVPLCSTVAGRGGYAISSGKLDAHERIHGHIPNISGDEDATVR